MSQARWWDKRWEGCSVAKLDAKRVQALSAPGMYGDGHGLYLNVAAGGSKRWILRVTLGGRRREIGLGSLHTVPLAEAQIKSQALRAEAKAGRDPTAKRNQRVTTFGDTTTTTSGRTHRSEIKRPQKRAGRLSNLRAPRPARLPKPKPRNMKTRPADSRYE